MYISHCPYVIVSDFFSGRHSIATLFIGENLSGIALVAGNQSLEKVV